MAAHPFARTLYFEEKAVGDAKRALVDDEWP